jgi:hypothetical protein
MDYSTERFLLYTKDEKPVPAERRTPLIRTKAFGVDGHTRGLPECFLEDGSEITPLGENTFKVVQTGEILHKKS